jgi:hypothetical protein
MRKYGLDALALVHRVEEVIGEPLNISETDLSNVQLSTFHHSMLEETVQ